MGEGPGMEKSGKKRPRREVKGRKCKSKSTCGGGM
jgi:hypothetical protein